jgi:hypothetical protein
MMFQKLSGLTKLQLSRLNRRLEKEASQARDLKTAAFKVRNRRRSEKKGRGWVIGHKSICPAGLVPCSSNIFRSK